MRTRPHAHAPTHNAAGKDDFLSDLSRENGKRATESDMLFTDQWAPATEIVQKEDPKMWRRTISFALHTISCTLYLHLHSIHFGFTTFIQSDTQIMPLEVQCFGGPRQGTFNWLIMNLTGEMTYKPANKVLLWTDKEWSLGGLIQQLSVGSTASSSGQNENHSRRRHSTTWCYTGH